MLAAIGMSISGLLEGKVGLLHDVGKPKTRVRGLVALAAAAVSRA